MAKQHAREIVELLIVDASASRNVVVHTSVKSTSLGRDKVGITWGKFVNKLG